MLNIRQNICLLCVKDEEKIPLVHENQQTLVYIVGPFALITELILIHQRLKKSPLETDPSQKDRYTNGKML